MSFQLYVKGGIWTAPNEIRMQNFAACPYKSTGSWDFSCFNRSNVLGHSSLALAWNSTSGSVTSNRSGLHVRGAASAYRGTFTIYKARIKVTYAVLR